MDTVKALMGKWSRADFPRFGQNNWGIWDVFFEAIELESWCLPPLLAVVSHY